MSEKKIDEADIFNVARKIDALEARAEYLNLACGDDAQLRGRIEQLLQALARQPEFLSSPPAEIAPTVDQPSIEHVAKPGNRIGPYKLLEKIGEGGMGTVFMANQERPVQRRVALKIIKPGRESEGTMARFEAERQALAMMDHPHIARVLDAGTTEDDRPYFVMELVKGVPITKYCDDNRLSLNDRLKLFLDVCNAVQHAHQKGVIHRDLKPTNILVAEYDDKAVPKVIDFGLAKALGQQLTEKTMFTGFGEIMGTLEYMSPEQAKFNQLDIDTRSDIYSLGVLLYELVTGSTPFDQSRLRKAALDEAVRIIRDEEPPRPSLRLSSITTLADVAAQRRIEPGKLRSLVRGELDWIAMKTLDKERTRRYQTSAALADDVHRYLTDQRVIARPPTAGYLLQKFARRNRIVISVAATLLVTFLIGFAGTVFNWLEARRLNSDLTAITDKLTKSNEQVFREKEKQIGANRELRRQRYQSDLPEALSAWERGDIVAAEQLLKRNRPTEADQEDLRDMAWDFVHNLVLDAQRCNPINYSFSGTPAQVAIAPSKRQMAVVGTDGKLSIFDLEHGKPIAELDCKADFRGSPVRYSHDSRLLAYSPKSGGLVVHDLATGNEQLHLNSGVVTSLMTTNDQSTFAVAHGNSIEIRKWFQDQPLEDPVLIKFNFRSECAAISPTSRFIAAGSSQENGLWFWDASTPLKSPWKLEETETAYRQIAFSPQGNYLAAGGYDDVVYLFKIEQEGPRLISKLTGHSGDIFSLSFSDNGKLLSSGARDNSVRIWDLSTLATKYILRGHHRLVTDVEFVGNDQLFTCGDNRVCAWQLKNLAPHRVTRIPTTRAKCCFINDRYLYVSTAGDTVLRRLDVETMHEAQELVDSRIIGIAAAPRRQRIALGFEEGAVEVRDLELGRLIRFKTDTQRSVRNLQFSPDGSLLAVAGGKGFSVWNVDSDPPTRQIDELIAGISVAFCDNHVAVGTDDGQIVVRSVTGEALTTSWQAHQTRVNGLEFSDDGQYIVSCSTDGFVKLWRTKNAELVCEQTREAGQWWVTFAPNDQSILTTGEDGYAVVRDRNTLKTRFRFPHLGGSGLCLAYSPSGKWLAASTLDGQIQVWDIHSER